VKKDIRVTLENQDSPEFKAQEVYQVYLALKVYEASLVNPELEFKERRETLD